MSGKTLISTLILAAIIALAVIIGLKFFKQVKTIKPGRGSLNNVRICSDISREHFRTFRA